MNHFCKSSAIFNLACTCLVSFLTKDLIRSKKFPINFSELLHFQPEIELFLHFYSYAPWCPACQSLKPTWTEFGTWAKDLDIQVGEVDITASPVLTGRCLITALPTIFHIKNGVFRQFKGSRQTKDFLDFVEEKQYESIEPMSALQDPGSIQMGILGYFFKVSYIMKDYHKILTEDYKFSTWVSYAFFTACTILVGGLLGLVSIDFGQKIVA